MTSRFHFLLIHFKTILLSVVVQGLLVTEANSQQPIGFIMDDNYDRVEIEFQNLSNLIVIPVKINNFLTTRFILDTGAESVILTDMALAQALQLQFVRSISISAPGVRDSIQAYVAYNASLSLTNKIKGTGFNVLVLDQDYLELNQNLGVEVYGIIGLDVFKRFVVDINYDENKIILHRPEKYKPKKYYQEVQMDVDQKPYISSVISQGTISDTIKFMVDTGASHAALLDIASTDHLVMPEKLLPNRLGQGIGGEIPGFLGRIEGCSIGLFEFENVLISVPEEHAYSKSIKRGSRHGTIGGDLLSRFHVIFNYPEEKMYISKGQHFTDKFEFNMSGMSLVANGKNLDSLVVHDVRKNSPAYHAGVKKGDHIHRINGMDLKNSTLSEINILLRIKDGKKIRMVICRDERRIKKQFHLKRLI